MGKMLVSRGIVLIRQEGKTFKVIAAKGFEDPVVGRTLELDRAPASIHSMAKHRGSGSSWFAFLAHTKQSIAVPIVTRRRVVGYITLGERLSRTPYSSTDKRIILSLVNLSGAAIEKALMIDQMKEVNRNLDRKIQELNTLFDLSREFNIGLDADKVIRLVTFALLGQIGVRSYAICLRTDGELNIITSKISEEVHLGEILPSICDLERASTTKDLLKLKGYRPAAAQLAAYGITAVIPMHIQHKTKGMILVGERLRGGSYSEADLEFLYSLGNLAIISIENARLFKEAIEKQKMEDELEIAREIQQGLLPETLPSIPRFELAAINIPSKQIGGDYYDVLELDSDEFALAIGDVSGKGMPAALLMANVQAALRAVVSPHTSIAETTGRINDLTCANTRGGSKFITFFWGILNSKTGQFRYSNAGHNPPYLLRRDGTVEMLEEGGLILGVFKTTKPYAEGSITLSAGDVMVLYTDGISEAMNADGEQLSEERLESVLKTATRLSASDMIRRVQKELVTHTEGTPQSDDITMLVVKAL
jgi:sigma-B regulation protein RsbU (phosphoserine phosphatase)